MTLLMFWTENDCAQRYSAGSAFLALSWFIFSDCGESLSSGLELNDITVLLDFSPNTSPPPLRWADVLSSGHVLGIVSFLCR